MKNHPVSQNELEWNPYKDEEEEPHFILEIDVKLRKFEVVVADSLFNAEIFFHHGKRGDDLKCLLVKARVLDHLTDENVNLFGIQNEYLKLNTTMYKVELCVV